MNAPEPVSLPDIQAHRDERNVPINAVGIKGVRYPVIVRSGEDCAPTVATFAMTVGLPATEKGTHMSRFVEVLEARHESALDAQGFKDLVLDMLHRLRAAEGTVEMRFPWFVRKAAPASGVQSLLDYECTWRGTVRNGHFAQTVQVLVPATSLCPCSKEISLYGAHNQRSHIGIEVQLAGDMSLNEIIKVAERSASCQVYGLLKRIDEKFVTERAYDNPRFVEDLVRDVALALHADTRVDRFVVDAENFESIHNHSAIARVEWTRRHEARVALAA